ncbi:MAG: carboxylesterase family protein [Lachnospiraceae bacterium]|nr:carboxylesterase family protein [Lachnospiraceae bacterium]
MLRETKTENGKVKGIPGADPRVTIYRGIPFAAPPVGKNRWRAPQPAEDWDGVRECYTFGPISVQDQPGVGKWEEDLYMREFHVDKDIPMSEDCLYLNVWTPANAADEKLPVLLWIFGGGFQWGYTAEMEFDGERLARRGVVVVSVNYRLGAIGFLSHPEITAEAPDYPGNFGLLDQQAGLRWVKRNIANFGGDPDQITIAGQSAGGGSVMAQIACEENFDIIKRAVVLSGMIELANPDQDIFNPHDLKIAEERGKAFFDYLGVGSLEEARALDAFEIRDKYAEYAKEHPRFFPIVDGTIVKQYGLSKFKEGKSAPIPIISGCTNDEFVFNGINSVERSVKSAYAAAQASGVEWPMYYYNFMPDIPGWDNPGCFHSCDLWFFFESVGKCWRPYKGYHYDLARQMCNYFANFIKTGDPNGKDADGTDMPYWAPYTEGKPVEMHFTSEGAKTVE